MYGCAVYAGQTDAWPGKQCSGSAPKEGTLFSVASGHQLALVGEPIFKNKQPHQVIPRQEVGGWAPGTNLAKIIPVMRTNCLHTLSLKPYHHLLQLVPSRADEDQSFKD